MGSQYGVDYGSALIIQRISKRHSAPEPGVDPILVSRWLYMVALGAHLSLLLWIQGPNSAGTYTRMLLMRC
jgi:hypothetical protein